VSAVFAILGKFIADAFGRALADIFAGLARDRANQARGAAEHAIRARDAAEQDERRAIDAGRRDEPITYRD